MSNESYIDGDLYGCCQPLTETLNEAVRELYKYQGERDDGEQENALSQLFASIFEDECLNNRQDALSTFGEIYSYLTSMAANFLTPPLDTSYTVNDIVQFGKMAHEIRRAAEIALAQINDKKYPYLKSLSRKKNGEYISLDPDGWFTILGIIKNYFIDKMIEPTTTLQEEEKKDLYSMLQIIAQIGSVALTIRVFTGHEPTGTKTLEDIFPKYQIYTKPLR